MFQSPCGDLVNRKLAETLASFTAICFSPLAGIWLIESGNWYGNFYGGHTVFQSPCGDLVNRKTENKIASRWVPCRFQSPCGDLVNRKRALSVFRKVASPSCFSPLAGIWLIERRNTLVSRIQFSQMFQSPCGDLVNRKSRQAHYY